MNTQNKENNSIPFVKDGDTVKVYAEKLTREIVDQLINMKDVKKIRLTGLVREIGGASFEGLDFAKTKWFDFSNANIEKVGCLAFHDCENIYFGQYFSNVQKVGKYAFCNAMTKNKCVINLRSLKDIPSGCFMNASIDYLDLAGAEQAGEDAFKNLKVTAINLSDKLYNSYMNIENDKLEGEKINF